MWVMSTDNVWTTTNGKLKLSTSEGRAEGVTYTHLKTNLVTKMVDTEGNRSSYACEYFRDGF